MASTFAPYVDGLLEDSKLQADLRRAAMMSRDALRRTRKKKTDAVTDPLIRRRVQQAYEAARAAAERIGEAPARERRRRRLRAASLLLVGVAIAAAAADATRTTQATKEGSAG
jgi:hypothetical protein